MVKLEKELDIHKRRILNNPKELIHDLKDELQMLLFAFYKAVNLYKDEVVLTPPHVRCRGHEAILLNSKMIQCVSEVFPDNSKFGKYKRFMLRIKGYICLFKKLDEQGLPMNIQTVNMELLNNQLQGRLFEIGEDGSEPILYFGYQMNRFGDIVSPQIVYIDNNKLQWRLFEEDIKALDVNVSPTIQAGETERNYVKLRDKAIKKSKAE